MDETPSYPQEFFEAPPGACQVVLVRHGQTMPYTPGRPFPTIDGHGDPPLSPRGRWQAGRVAERLAHEPVRAIYVSSLTRTHQTAAPLAERLGLEPAVEPDLREVFLGELEAGLFREASATGHPAIEEMRRTGDWGSIPGAESNASFQTRCVAGLTRIARGHLDDMVVVVCHGGVISALLAHAMGTPLHFFGGARNGSLSHLYVTPDRWFVRSWNDAGHIGPHTHDEDPPAR